VRKSNEILEEASRGKGPIQWKTANTLGLILEVLLDIRGLLIGGERAAKRREKGGSGGLKEKA
jgi:hypothetical protein